MNWATHGFKFNAKGLGYFAVGAASGALGSGIGAGMNVAMAGGTFSAGFMGTATGISSTGFLSGAITGIASGSSSGFIANSGNAWLGGSNFLGGLWSGVKGATSDALFGGLVGGTIGGIDALIKGTNFWTGETSFDLSGSYGASGTPIGEQTITGKYVGKFHEVNLYESSSLKSGSAATFPGRGIILSKGEFTMNGNSIPTEELLQHEFGHILQARIAGLIPYYRVIAPESLASAAMDGVLQHVHRQFWTETWANFLSSIFFGQQSLLIKNLKY